MRYGQFLAGCAGLLLAGCGGGLPDVARLTEPEPIRTRAEAPPNADPNACYGREVTPAIVETVTEQVLMQPAEIASDGRVLYPATFKTETHQRILRERRELWFETPCEAAMTPEFIATLQRALAARGHYAGSASGEMTARTRHAIRAYQSKLGLDSAILSLAAARQLGLIAVERPPRG